MSVSENQKRYNNYKSDNIEVQISDLSDVANIEFSNSKKLKSIIKTIWNIHKESITHPFQTTKISSETGEIKKRSKKAASLKGLLKTPLTILKEIIVNPFSESNISLLTGETEEKQQKFIREVEKNS